MTTVLNTIPEAAAKLRASRAAIFRWIRIGRIKPTRLSKRKVFITDNEINRVIGALTK